MANNIPRQGLSLKELKDRIATQLANGTDADNVVMQLIERGWPEQSARYFVRSTLPAVDVLREQALERRDLLKDDRARILRGLFCVILGLIIIAVGLGMHDVGNGIYHFTMGVLLIVFEAHDFTAGLSGWFRHRR